MKKDLIVKIAGTTIIFAGMILFAGQLVSLNILQKFSTAAVCGILGVSFLINYLARGFRKWGLFIPASLFCSAALVAFLYTFGYHKLILITPLMAGLGFPFLVGFLLNPRQNRWAILPATFLAALAVAVISLLTFHRFLFPILLIICFGFSFTILLLVSRSRIAIIFGKSAFSFDPNFHIPSSINSTQVCWVNQNARVGEQPIQ
jgi:hypothetical protein